MRIELITTTVEAGTEKMLLYELVHTIEYCTAAILDAAMLHCHNVNAAMLQSYRNVAMPQCRNPSTPQCQNATIPQCCKAVMPEAFGIKSECELNKTRPRERVLLCTSH